MTAFTGKALLYCAGGGIGDSLMASLVARALHGRYLRVDALTLPAHRSTLERVPDVDEILVDDGGDEEALVKQLEARAYDACVVTWATSRTARVPQRARIPVRVGQARRLYSWRFTHRVPVRSELGDVTTHWSQIVLDYARVLQCDTDDVAPRFVPTTADLAEAQALLASLHLSKDAYVMLHPTNAIAPKRGMWPVEGWAELARALRGEFRVPVLLSGSADDAGINSSVLRRAQDDEGRADDAIIDIAGKTGIGAFGSLAQHARAFVGITTGSMHIAAAVGAPTVGIFPFQTDTPERWAPIGARTAIVRATYPCRPGERKETCPDYACIANLDVPRILAAARSLLSAR
ncbi:MAG TPA: glycosyltransferase family 9 protein [Candidatus Baltobacteraceae bacterium]|nr:glycosyltransferase family 9 protein [Candidatus Baltobacteraceae bacterium]